MKKLMFLLRIVCFGAMPIVTGYAVNEWRFWVILAMFVIIQITTAIEENINE